MENNEQRKREEKTVLADFVGTDCSICGKKKESAKSFCLGCYYRLPKKMRNALFLRMGMGYEAAFQNAQKWLRTNHE